MQLPTIEENIVYHKSGNFCVENIFALKFFRTKSNATKKKKNYAQFFNILDQADTLEV